MILFYKNAQFDYLIFWFVFKQPIVNIPFPSAHKIIIIIFINLLNINYNV